MTTVTLKDSYFGEYYWQKAEIIRGICCKCNSYGTVRLYISVNGRATKMMAMCLVCEKQQIIRESDTE